MTLKYESELLFDLMKRDGEDTPSDVLPYESELKEKYLNQVVGAYPKLQDYQPEWLNYNLYHHLPSDFPVESVANVTSASFNNVVPYAYGSAILKGCTIKTSKITWSTGKYLDSKSGKLNEGTGAHRYTEEFFECEPNTIYEVVGNNNYKKLCFYDSNKTFIKGYNSDTINFDSLKHQSPSNTRYLRIGTTITSNSETPTGLSEELTVYNRSLGISVIGTKLKDKLLSVQMPVLTTTGKNLCDTSKYIDGGISNGNMLFKKDKYRSYYMKCKPSTSYVISVENSNNRFGAGSSHLFSENKPFELNNEIIVPSTDTTGQTLQIKITTTEMDKYLYVYVANNGVFNPNIRVQVEESSTATPYEPFKSNILTVNEDVELRGIGNVQDELDLVTGEVVERIGEVIFDGSVDENWELWATYPEESAIFKISKENSLKFMKEFDRNGVFKCDKFSTVLKSSIINNGVAHPHAISFFGSDKEYIQLRVYKSLLKSIDVTGLREYLTNEPIAVQYKLVTESVKTVDLTVTDQDGISESTIIPIEGTMRVSTSSQTFPPSLDMSVPVEATTQNLMSFANIEGEE